MATSKTLTPTNVTIQIPAFADKPDQRVNSNCIDKEADAINALSDQIGEAFEVTTDTAGVTITAQRNNKMNGANKLKFVDVKVTLSSDINGTILKNFPNVAQANSILPVYLVSATETKIYSIRISNGTATTNGAIPAGSYDIMGHYM